ncbi:MAG: hypothetical protein WBO24_16230 [Nitrospirales bacterium]
MTNTDSIPPLTPPASDLPDRLCTWCQTSMLKRLVGDGRFIHYTCPKCIFQHTSKVVAPQP